MTQIQEKQTNALNGYLMVLVTLIVLSGVVGLALLRLIPFAIPAFLLFALLKKMAFIGLIHFIKRKR